MKNRESFQEQKKEIILTPDQKAHNPNGFWERFFEQNREQLSSVFEKNSDPDNGTVKEILKEAMRGLKKKKEFTSEEDLLERGLKYYSEKHGGFGDAKGLEEKYKNLRELQWKRFADKVVEEMKDVEYDSASEPIEKAVAKLLEEEPDITHDEVTEFRNQLWERFMAKKKAE